DVNDFAALGVDVRRAADGAVGADAVRDRRIRNPRMLLQRPLAVRLRRPLLPLMFVITAEEGKPEHDPRSVRKTHASLCPPVQHVSAKNGIMASANLEITRKFQRGE